MPGRGPFLAATRPGLVSSGLLPPAVPCAGPAFPASCQALALSTGSARPSRADRALGNGAAPLDPSFSVPFAVPHYGWHRGWARNVAMPLCQLKAGKGIAWPSGHRGRDARGGGLLDVGQQ